MSQEDGKTISPSADSALLRHSREVQERDEDEMRSEATRGEKKRKGASIKCIHSSEWSRLFHSRGNSLPNKIGGRFCSALRPVRKMRVHLRDRTVLCQKFCILIIPAEPWCTTLFFSYSSVQKTLPCFEGKLASLLRVRARQDGEFWGGSQCALSRTP